MANQYEALGDIKSEYLIVVNKPLNNKPVPPPTGVAAAPPTKPPSAGLASDG
jgi:hypothetical protein